MSSVERWVRLLLRFFPPDFRDEMGGGLLDAYRRQAEEAKKRGGLRVAAVWLAALRDSLWNGLGERIKPAVQWRRGGDWGRDMQLVTRRLRQKPLFFTAVLGTLTVGLGTFAVVYAAVDKIVLEPLPYRDPAGLYKVWVDVPRLNLHEVRLLALDVYQLARAGGPIQDAAFLNCGNGAIPANDSRDAFHINMMAASSNILDVLGARPSMVRGFRHEDGDIAPGPIILSDAMWKRLGASPNIVGSRLRIGPDTHTVIGVMPPDFAFSCSTSQRTDTYEALNLEHEQGGAIWLTVLRAHPGCLARAGSSSRPSFGPKPCGARAGQASRFCTLRSRAPGRSGQRRPARAFGVEFRCILSAVGPDRESCIAIARPGG